MVDCTPWTCTCCRSIKTNDSTDQFTVIVFLALQSVSLHRNIPDVKLLEFLDTYHSFMTHEDTSHIAKYCPTTRSLVH